MSKAFVSNLSFQSPIYIDIQVLYMNYKETVLQLWQLSSVMTNVCHGIIALRGVNPQFGKMGKN